jgi:predicted nucleotidyltransferase
MRILRHMKYQARFRASGMDMIKDRKDTTKQDLETIVDCVLKNVAGVEAIYLFGSLAKGTENAESDYDVVAFVSKHPESDIKTISNVRYYLLDKLSRPLDFIIIETEDLAYPSVILYNICRDSKLLYGHDILKEYERVAARMKPIVIKGATIGYYV